MMETLEYLQNNLHTGFTANEYNILQMFGERQIPLLEEACEIFGFGVECTEYFNVPVHYYYF